MINHVLPRMACSCAILVVALAHCGCQSLSGSPGWTAWKSKPRQAASNDKEVVTYWGQKKKKEKAPDADELKKLLVGAKNDGTKPTFDSLMRQGTQSLRANRLPEAREAFEKALAMRSDNADCHHSLAVVADKEGQFGAADNHYEAALKQRPRDPNLLSDLGYSYSLRGEDRRAEATLEQALAISPTHKGAMANLGAIYSRQDRYEDALAMFKRGASDAEAQQYLAQLFPQRGRTPNFDQFAQNNNSAPPRNSNPPATNERPDLTGMTPEQVRDAMNKAREAGRLRRQQQMEQEIAPPREWHEHNPQVAQVPNQPNGNVPIELGPNTPSQPRAMPNDLPVVVPNGGTGFGSSNSQGFSNPGAASSGIANNGYNQGQTPFGQGQGAVPHGTANAMPQDGSLRAQPGANPNIELWNGAPIRDDGFQRAGMQPQNPNGQGVVNVPYYPQPNQAQNQNPGAQQRPLNGLNLQPSAGPQGNNGFNGAGANQAAAQLGMNLGPGGLFPVVPSDATQGSQNQPSTIQHQGGWDFPSPPSYQDPAHFEPQSRNSSDLDRQQLAPPSPASGWGQMNGGVVQAGGIGNPRAGEQMERPSPESSVWADKPNLNRSAPFTGSWPPGSQSTPNVNGNGGPAGSLPMWNGGQSNPRPQPKQLGPATNQGDYYPEPWPGSRR
jgi:Flp pilus assembly protein TadD